MDEVSVSELRKHHHQICMSSRHHAFAAIEILQSAEMQIHQKVDFKRRLSALSHLLLRAPHAVEPAPPVPESLLPCPALPHPICIGEDPLPVRDALAESTLVPVTAAEVNPTNAGLDALGPITLVAQPAHGVVILFLKKISAF